MKAWVKIEIGTYKNDTTQSVKFDVPTLKIARFILYRAKSLWGNIDVKT